MGVFVCQGVVAVRLKRLDGIRALAILAVIGRHGFLLPYGWAGVDLFFVLSGFLITSILRRERDNTSFLAPFYVKRATRILPPMLCAIAIAYLLFPIPWHRTWPYFAFFGANIAEVRFPNDVYSLGVLWSLAVEEHFYLVWPLAIRHLDRRGLIRLLAGLLVLEPVLRALVTPWVHSAWPIAFLTPFRLDPIAAGSLLAILIEDEETANVLREWSGKVAIGLLCMFVVLVGTTHSFRREANLIPFNALGYTLIAGIAAAFIAYVVLQEDAWVSRILSSRPLAFIGLISYGMYLFHPAIMLPLEAKALAMHVPHRGPIVTVITIPVAVAVSWISFRFYERPLIQWGHRKAKAMNETEPAPECPRSMATGA